MFCLFWGLCGVRLCRTYRGGLESSSPGRAEPHKVLQWNDKTLDTISRHDGNGWGKGASWTRTISHWHHDGWLYSVFCHMLLKFVCLDRYVVTGCYLSEILERAQSKRNSGFVCNRLLTGCLSWWWRKLHSETVASLLTGQKYTGGCVIVMYEFDDFITAQVQVQIIYLCIITSLLYMNFCKPFHIFTWMKQY